MMIWVKKYENIIHKNYSNSQVSTNVNQKYQFLRIEREGHAFFPSHAKNTRKLKLFMREKTKNAC